MPPVPRLDLPPLPPGSALRFSSEAPEKPFAPSLLQNLEGEMSRLLEWASRGDAQRTSPQVPRDRRERRDLWALAEGVVQHDPRSAARRGSLLIECRRAGNLNNRK